MGMCNYSMTWKNCATCAVWDGVRKANDDKNSVTVDNSQVGVCNGFWKGARKYCNDKCREWKKWPELTGQSPEREI